MGEVERGFLLGPYTESQVDSLLNCSDWSASKRFLLLQGEDQKPRVIDDFKMSAVNSSYGSTSYLNLQDADFLSCFLMHLGKLLSTRSHGGPERTTEDVHADWLADPGFEGRGVDLTKAYKQLSVHPTSLKHAVVAVRKEDGSWAFFLSHSLPFGATASVFAFNKLTKALWSILTRKFSLLVTVFYDDFPIIEHSAITSHTTRLLEAFFDLLGWDHATSGKKAVSFSPQMTVLGLVFELGDIAHGKLRISNKEGRVERIKSKVESIQTGGTLDRDVISVLEGLLNFAGRFVLGRALRRPMHLLTGAASSGMTSAKVKDFCRTTLSILSSLRPRYISVLANSSPILVYTDASYEDGLASWGAVIIDLHSTIFRQCTMVLLTLW